MLLLFLGSPCSNGDRTHTSQWRRWVRSLYLWTSITRRFSCGKFPGIITKFPFSLGYLIHKALYCRLLNFITIYFLAFGENDHFGWIMASALDVSCCSHPSIQDIPRDEELQKTSSSYSPIFGLMSKHCWTLGCVEIPYWQGYWQFLQPAFLVGSGLPFPL